MFQRIAGHAATPEHRIVRVDEEADGEHLHTVFLLRTDKLSSLHGFQIGSRILQSEHLRNGRTEDVRIQQSDLVTFVRQSHGEVGRDGGFAHASLAGRYRDDVLHLRKQLRRLRRQLCLIVYADVPHDIHLLAHVGEYGLFGSLHQ